MKKQIILDILDNINNDPATLDSYITGEWLQARDIAHVIILSNSLVYPDERQQIYFDDSNEIMYIRQGKYVDGYGSEFKQESIRYAIPFSSIIGIQLVTETRRKSPYKYGLWN